MRKYVLIVSFAAFLTVFLQPALAQELQSPASKSLSNPGGTQQGAQDAASNLQIPLIPVPADAVPASTGFDYPVGDPSYHGGYEMNNCFGCDYLDLWGHTGEDFDSGAEGGPVYSVSEGVVAYVGVGPGAWGNVIIIRHIVRGVNYYSQYAHVRDIFVVTGQVVGRRQQIATVGTTGTTAPHLHFEIKDQPMIGHGYTGYGFSGLTIQDAGMNYWAPSWFIDTHRYYWDDMPTTPPPPGRHYYWTWYDNMGSRNWLLLANTVDGNTLNFDVNIRGKTPDLNFFGGATVAAGQVATPMFPGLMGGPVVNTSLTGDKALVSQRIIWGASSLEEVPGIDETNLSSHYYWSWYDMLSPGFRNWVLVANTQSSASVFADVKIAGLTRWSGTIGAGQNIPLTFPGVMGGPVEVLGWTDSGRSTPAYVLASQRVLINGDTAFNEVPGTTIPDSSRFLWTWYDELSAGSRNWVLVANTYSDVPIFYEVRIAGESMASGQIGPGNMVTPEFPGVMGGPVEVQVWRDAVGGSEPASAIVSQRMLWGPSFEEVTGYPNGKLVSDYHWTWYDQQSRGMINWVLVSNPGDEDAFVEIAVGGGIRWSGIVQAGGSVTPTFNGLMGGPVEVKAWKSELYPQDDPLAGQQMKATPAAVMTSQRVLYNGFFNEVTGTVLNP